MAKKATNSQIGSFLSSLIALFFSEKAEKVVAELKYEKIQQAIDWEDKLELMRRIIKFINNGCDFFIVIAQQFINFDRIPTLPFERAELSERLGKSIVGTVAFKPSQWKAENELKDGEISITGHEFLKRLKDGKRVVPNSNMIDWLVEHQDEPGLKEFLDQYRGKVLYAFGDIFRNSSDLLCVRCALVRDDRWTSNFNWLDNDLAEYNLGLLLADTK